MQVRPEYKPKQSKPEKIVESAVRLDQDKRDPRGRLVFKDVPNFKPTLRPKDVIQAGSFGGCVSFLHTPFCVHCFACTMTDVASHAWR